MDKAALIAFEARVAEAFKAQQVKGPIHLSGGNEDELIEIFREIDRADWVFATYRSHYAALLHGIDPEWLFAEILAGRSMGIHAPLFRFFSSAIVGGCLPIAVGVAAALKRQGSKDRVWCFLGDMAYTTGAYHEAQQYAGANMLPIKFIIEDNGFSCDTPTAEAWGPYFTDKNNERHYTYERIYPHSGIGKYVF